MYPDAYLLYLVHFHGDRDYFECHEILEEYWKTTNEGKQSIWVGFILLAVSNYHFRRENYEGANRTLCKAITIFEQQPQTELLGIDMDLLMKQLKNQLSSIQTGGAYKSIHLPISDPFLLAKCKEICTSKGFLWGQKTKQEPHLLHRHIYRDRNDVILQRQKALNERHTK